jgi:cysteine desulfurase/selenocysteine lyase
MGLENVRARIAALVSKLRDGLSSRGWEIRTPEGSCSAILAAVPPGGDAREASRRLEEKGVVVAPREGAVRFSPHAGNDEDEIGRVLEILAGW